MITLLIGQIIFRIRHPDQAYSMRTNYTVRSNREWNNLSRNNRIQKKISLVNNVNEIKTILDQRIF